MVIDGEMVHVTVGNKMLFSTDIKNIGEATVAYLASFYLLDFDYPKSCEVDYVFCNESLSKMRIYRWTLLHHLKVR